MALTFVRRGWAGLRLGEREEFKEKRSMLGLTLIEQHLITTIRTSLMSAEIDATTRKSCLLSQSAKCRLDMGTVVSRKVLYVPGRRGCTSSLRDSSHLKVLKSPQPINFPFTIQTSNPEWTPIPHQSIPMIIHVDSTELAPRCRPAWEPCPCPRHWSPSTFFFPPAGTPNLSQAFLPTRIGMHSRQRPGLPL